MSDICIMKVWAKLPAISEAFERNPEAEWVWWLDTDAIIMTPNIDLASHLLNPEAMKPRIARGSAYRLSNGEKTDMLVPENFDVNMADMVIAQDANGVNAGSFFMRRSDWTRSFLDIWGDPVFYEKNFERQEQDVLNHIMLHHPKMREHIAIVPQRVLNAFSVGGEDMGWMTGDLVVHFAGCWVDNDCDRRWKSFWSRRITVNTAYQQKLDAEQRERAKQSYDTDTLQEQSQEGSQDQAQRSQNSQGISSTESEDASLQENKKNDSGSKQTGAGDSEKK